MRKTYTKEFKLQICSSILNGQSKISEIANEYSISRPIISRWVAEYKRYGTNSFTGKGVRLPDEARLYALEKENSHLKEENAILKKFKGFAKSQRR